jgi:hypothetical protein
VIGPMLAIPPPETERLAVWVPSGRCGRSLAGVSHRSLSRKVPVPVPFSRLAKVRSMGGVYGRATDRA